MALRIAAWNIGLVALALAFAMLAGETWLRLTKPFMFVSHQREFVAGVGPMFVPGSEARLTDARFFWTVSRANAWGFLDRPPVPAPRPNPDPATATPPRCHVALIGDSFLVARQVPIADKVHVRLEAELAAMWPHLSVTTTAFGMVDSGQINQLPLYDHYARRLSPGALVLVFVGNDFANNSATLSALRARRPEGRDPLRQPRLTAALDARGGFVLRPPQHPGHRQRRGTAASEPATLLGS